jgi:DNA phosphorothioation-dependent restriction protein DptH
VTTAWQDEVIRRLRDTIVQIGLAPQGDGPGALLDQLKVLSGRFALRALTTPTGGADIASLAAVIAWLRARNRLTQAILVPVNFHGHLFGDPRVRIDRGGEEYCECMLVSLRRNIVEATMIAVRWRRGDEDLEDLAYDMLLPLERTQRLMSTRFFDENRVDGSLQRARFTSVLRFYFERAQRYGLLDAAVVSAFLDHLGRLEKSGLDFRARYEGYIVAPSGPAIAPFALGDARITVLRPDDLAMGTLFSPRERPDTITQLSYESGSDSGASNNGSEIIAVTISGVDGDAAASLAALDEETESDNKPGVDWPHSPTTVEHDPELEVRNAERPTRSPILLGTSKAADTPVLWQPGVQGSPHMFVLGIPGQGTSWTVARAVGELSKQGVPALILDFHGQFTGSEGPLAGARQATVLDARQGLPFSPFEVSTNDHSNGTIDWQSNAFAIAEIFGYVCKLGDMQKDVVFTAVRDAYRSLGFQHVDDAEELNVDSYPTLRDVLARIERQERAGRASNVAARCRPLLELDLFRPSDQGDDLLTLVRRGLVIDLHGLADLEVLQLAAGAFVLRKVYKDMFSWGPADDLRLVIVLDEAHRLARDLTLPKLMKEGRKFGIAVIVASQGIADFHADVLSNAGTKVIFRMNHPESRKAAGFIRAPQGVDMAARIEQLAVGQAYVQTSEMRMGTLVQMAAP